MQNNVSMITIEKDLDIKYGICDPGPEREAARGSVKFRQYLIPCWSCFTAKIGSMYSV